MILTEQCGTCTCISTNNHTHTHTHNTVHVHVHVYKLHCTIVLCQYSTHVHKLYCTVYCVNTCTCTYTTCILYSTVHVYNILPDDGLMMLVIAVIPLCYRLLRIQQQSQGQSLTSLRNPIPSWKTHGISE